MSETPTAQAFTDHSLRLAQIANPESDDRAFRPRSAAARLRRRARALLHRLPDLRHAERREVEPRAGLPCADRRPACGEPPSRHRQARLVGDHGRPGQADRHRPLLRHLPQRDRRLHGLDRPKLAQSRHGRSLTGLDFPVITMRDMVRAQARLLDHLGIPDVLCVLGGSMGGMQVLEWAATYPDRVFSAVPIACAARHSSQNIAFHEVGRQAVMADPDWCQGRYLDEGKSPRKGLAVARMAAHITYLSDDALHHEVRPQPAGPRQGRLRLRRRLPGGELSAPPGHELRRPLRRQHLSLHHARHGLFRPRRRPWRRARQRLRRHATRFCLVSFTSDWLFPTEESREIVHALNAVAAKVSFVEIKTDKGHDAFLLHEPELFDTIRGFLGAARARHRGAKDGCHEPQRAAARGPRRRHQPRRPAAHRRDGEPGARVLDIGCGDGTLLRLLAEKRGVDGARHRAEPGRGELLRGARPRR